jgi:hypothetical protein
MRCSAIKKILSYSPIITVHLHYLVLKLQKFMVVMCSKAKAVVVVASLTAKGICCN